MGSYLHNLAAHALGSLEVVRPRTLSRFEPAASEVAETNFIAASDEQWPAVPEPGGADDPRWIERDPAARRLEERPRQRQIPDLRSGPLLDVGEKPGRVEATGLAESVLSRAQHSQTAPLPASDPELPVAGEPSFTPRHDRPATRRPPSSRFDTDSPTQSPVGDRWLEPATVDRVATNSTAIHDSPPATEAGDSLDPKVVRQTATGRQEPRAAGRMDAPERGAPTAPASELPVPAITVMIGRIEVRATRPEPIREASRGPRPRPRLTLDAFLDRDRRRQ